MLAVVVFWWLYLILIVFGTIFMRGNPFFTQERPGKDEKIFKLIKFRTMDNRKDKKGNFLPDDVRLNKYGKFLRKTSLDELPEAFNIIKGDMSVIGPRPLLVSYLPYYTDEEKHRHDVRPGLSGLAQVNGRNTVTWEEKFSWDLKYVEKITFLGDLKIIIETVKKAFIKVEGVQLNYEGNLAEIRKKQNKQEE
jgi:general glycosylation pathway protein